MNPGAVAETAPTPVRHRVRWIVLGAFGLVLAAAGAIFLNSWVGAGKVLEREQVWVEERAAQLRQERAVRPILFEPAEEGNAWEMFQKALKELEPFTARDLDVFPNLAGDEVPKIDDPAIALMIERLRPAFDHLRSALRRREVELGINYEDLLNIQLPHISGSIKITRILADSARHKLRLGEGRAALEFFAIGFGAADLAAAKGQVIEELVRITVSGILKEPLKEMLSSHGAPPSDLQWFGEALDRLERARPHYVACLRREDLMCRQVYLKMVREKWKLPAIFSPVPVSPWYRRLLPLRIQGAQWLTWQEGVIRSLENVALLDLPAQPAAAQKVIEELKKEPSPVSYLMQHVPKTWGQWLQNRQSMTLARLAVAVAEFGAEMGAYPTALEDLVPRFMARVPTDPWNGKPFRYVNRGGSAIVYALGGDGDDDGGRPVPDEDYLEDDGDIVWTVKRREPPAK